MKRSKSRKNAAIPSKGVVVAGVKLDPVAYAARFALFVQRFNLGKAGSAFPWQSAGAETRTRYRHPGRPTRFQSLEEFYEGVLAYFEACDKDLWGECPSSS